MEMPARTVRFVRRGGGFTQSLSTAVVAAGIALAMLLGLAGIAQAAQAFPQLSKFCSDGTGGGQCARASGLAISPSNGHIFEVDTQNNRVQEFTPWGEFVKAFGWSVVASGPGNKPRNEIQQLAVAATGGSFKLRYGFPGGFTAAETAPILFQPGLAPTAAQVQSALVNAPSVTPDSFGPGDLNVSGSAGGPWTIEFVGQYADTDFGGGNFVLEGIKEWENPDTEEIEGLTGVGAAATLTTTQPGGNYEVCIPADGDVCRDGSPGSNPGQFGGNSGWEIGPQGVALDSSGDVYVLDRQNHRIQKYDADGNFLLMFGGGVNQTTGEDVCTAAQVEGGELCGAGTVGNPGSGEGEFGKWQIGGLSIANLGDYLAVGPDDTVYVGDTNRIQRFGTGGAFQGQMSGAVAGETVQSLDIGPEGTIYATFVNPAVATNFSSKPNVRILDGGGNQIGQLPVADPRGIATDAEGNVFVVTAGADSTSTVLAFTAAGVPIDLDPDSSSSAFGEEVLRLTTGIAAASSPTCGLAGTNLAVSSYLNNGTANSIYLFGGAPDPAVCPQPQVPPTIGSPFATSVDTGSAVVKARINPRFWPDTRYYVEYGTGKCSEGGCTLTRPAPPGALLTPNVLNVDVLTSAVVLPDLEPGTTYHYRFVADSGGGDPVTGDERTFRTGRASTSEAGCPNDVFRTGPSAALPDCRAYELVSPLDKASGGDIARSDAASLVQADPSGRRMSFTSLRSFAGPEGAPLLSQYLALREGEGWSTASISPPRSALSLYTLGGSDSNYFKALSPDLCEGWVIQDSAKTLTDDAPVGVPNLYRRDNCAGGGYELLTSTLPPGFGPAPYSSLYYPAVQGFSEDASRTVFRANAALAVSAGGPRPPFMCSTLDKPAGPVAYRWLRDGAPIGGATNPTYTSVAADVGKTLQCQVTATAAGKTSLVASEPLLVAPVASPAPPNPGFKTPSAADLPGMPTIAGTSAVGSTLTCEPGPWNGSPAFAYQWLRNGALIGGAASSTYVPVPADEGTSIQCRITGTNAGGAAVSFSRSVTVAADLPLAISPPALSGTPEAGQTLTCDEGTWQGATSFAYQWLRGGAVIGGAASSEYALAAADEGEAIQCRVDAANAEATVAATSAGLLVAPPPGTTPPSRLTAGGTTGTPETGETLTCEKGSWTGSPTFAYQWLRDGTEIVAASADEYTLTAADEGKAIQCQVSAANAGGTVVALDGDEGGALYAAPHAAPRVGVTTIGNQQVYVASESGLRLVSVLPNGTATAEKSAKVGTAWSVSLGSNSIDDAVHRAVSADGTRVFWTATAHEGPITSGTGPGDLYLRLNATEPQSAISGGKCTEALKACTIPVSASNQARFISADPQGSRVVYLVGSEAEKGLQLFTGEVDVSGSEPVVSSELVAGGVSGVVGVSEDAGRIYFVSREALSGDLNSEDDEAVAGEPNLYFFEQGSPLEFVATLAEKDTLGGITRPAAAFRVTPVFVSPNRRSSRVTPDGLRAAFTATASSTGYDNADAVSGEANTEVYLYDAAAEGGEGKLVCTSCNPSGARPTGRLVNSGVAGTADDVWAAAAIPGWSNQFQPTRALADDGKRVYFNAYDSLVPGDSNGRADVYQWEAPGSGSCTEAGPSFSESNGGCIRLISSGQSAEDSEFLDATPNGSDVFFLTQASLVPDDYGLRDVYDARVNGGFAPRTPAGQGCQGDACQSPPAPPGADTPSSATFNGQGNVKEASPRPRCPKGRSKARKNGRTVCVKNRKPKAKKQGKKRAGSAKKGGAR